MCQDGPALALVASAGGVMGERLSVDCLGRTARGSGRPWHRARVSSGGDAALASRPPLPREGSGRRWKPRFGRVQRLVALIALLALHAVVGLGIIASGDRLGRRALLVGAVPPALTFLWLGFQVPDLLDGEVDRQSTSLKYGA